MSGKTQITFKPDRRDENARELSNSKDFDLTYFLTVQDFDNKFIHKNKPLKSLDDALAMISPRYLPLSEGKLTSLAQRPLSDPQAAFARGPGEGPLMAESCRWCSARSNGG